MTEFLKAVILFEEEGASVMSEFLNGVKLLEKGVDDQESLHGTALFQER